MSSESLHRLVWLLHDDGPVERQPLAPGAHEDDLGDLALIALETSPHRACGRVVFLFLGKRSIDTDDDVIAGRKTCCRRLPKLATSHAGRCRLCQAQASVEVFRSKSTGRVQL